MIYVEEAKLCQRIKGGLRESEVDFDDGDQGEKKKTKIQTVSNSPDSRHKSQSQEFCFDCRVAVHENNQTKMTKLRIPAAYLVNTDRQTFYGDLRILLFRACPRLASTKTR